MQEKSAQIVKVERFLKKCVVEAENHQIPWLNLASEIYDLIDGRVSTESETDVHINTVGTGYERIKAELTRGLTNFDKWLVVEHAPGSLQELMTPLEANKLLSLVLEECNPRTAIVDMLGAMLVENRSGIKLHPYYLERPGRRKSFRVKWVPITLNNYLVDPADPKQPLYEFFISYMPKYKAMRLPRVYKDVVRQLPHYEPVNMAQRLYNEGEIDGTIQSAKQARFDVRIMEFWGTVLDENGEVLVWKDGDKEMPLENVQILCANDGTVLADPLPNKRYSGNTPFITAPLLRSGKSAYRPGLLVNGAELNKHLNVLMSSLITGGIKAAHNVTVVHSQYLKNPEVVQNGLEPNMTLVTNEDMPPGAKVFESEKIGDIPQEGIQLYQIMRQLAGENMFASDQFMTGNTRSSDTATAQIQSQNVIGGLFEALDAVLEDEIIEEVGTETFQEALRNRKAISDEELLWIFSGDEARATVFKEFPEKDLLILLATAFKFRGKGLRSRAASKGRAQAFVQFASMVMGNQLVAQQFLDSYSFKAFLSKGLEALELDPEELNLSERELDLIMHRKMAEQQAMAQAQAQAALGQEGAPQEGPGAANPMMGAASPSDFPQGQQEGQGF
jgi:hypothetical protein